MKLLLKILVAPFALALSVLTALFMFLFDICAFLLTIASVILAVLGVALFFTPTPIGGIVFLFLLSRQALFRSWSLEAHQCAFCKSLTLPLRPHE